MKNKEKIVLIHAGKLANLDLYTANAPLIVRLVAERLKANLMMNRELCECF